MSQISGGTTANLHGQSFEKHIITQLESKGLETITSKEFDKVLQLSNFKEKLNEHYPNGVIATGRNYYKSIYGNPNCFNEYRIFKDGIIYRLECKWQQKSGSKHEAIPYFYLNFVENCFKESVVIFVYGGEYMDKPSKWLKNAWKNRKYITDPNFDKDLKILDLDNFISWSNEVFN